MCVIQVASFTTCIWCARGGTPYIMCTHEENSSVLSARFKFLCTLKSRKNTLFESLGLCLFTCTWKISKCEFNGNVFYRVGNLFNLVNLSLLVYDENDRRRGFFVVEKMEFASTAIRIQC